MDKPNDGGVQNNELPPGASPTQDDTPIDKTLDLKSIQEDYFTKLTKHEAKSYQLEQSNRELQSRLEALTSEVEAWKKDPYTAFEKNGGNIDVITNRIMNNGKPPVDEVVTNLHEKIASLEQKLIQREETEKEREARIEQEKYFSGYVSDVKNVFNSEDYAPVLQAIELEEELMGRSPDIGAIIRPQYEEHYKNTGKGLTPAESASKMLKDAQQLVERVRASKTLKKILGVSDQEGGAPPKETPSSNALSRNLTNSMETNGGSPSPRRPDQMTDREWYDYLQKKVTNS